MSDQVVGTCSLCGGAVVIPRTWYSTIPPVPTCHECGAFQKNPYGEIIEMQPIKEAETNHD